MSDPRITLLRGGLAALALEGLVEAEAYRATEAFRCAAAAAAIRREPSLAAEQDDQLLFGEGFDGLDEEGGFVLGQARRDGYVGWVERSALTPGEASATHWVSALRTYAFSRPDLKSAPQMLLSMNSLVAVEERDGRFARIAEAAWVFEGHLAPAGQYRDDLAAVAEAFVGAPYQWGGRESLGLDCSGLVQQALYACGRAGPRDTDMQASGVGEAIDRHDLVRGDLVFWKGHVGMMLDEVRLVHANAHHMATVIEPLDVAVARIAAVAGQPSGFRRP